MNQISFYLTFIQLSAIVENLIFFVFISKNQQNIDETDGLPNPKTPQIHADAPKKNRNTPITEAKKTLKIVEF